MDAYAALHPMNTAADVAVIDIEDFNPFSSWEPVDPKLGRRWRQALETQQKLISGLEQLGAVAELNRQWALRERPFTLQPPKRPAVSDGRKIDADLFWRLMEECRPTAGFSSVSD